MTRALITLGLMTLLAIVPSYANGSVSIHVYSQATESGHGAGAGGSINVSRHSPGQNSSSGSSHAPVSYSGGGGSPSATEAPPEPFPTISASSPLYKNPHPGGPKSFWYSAEGRRCIYEASNNGICFNVVRPGTEGNPQPPINPAAIAEAAANSMNLRAGQIAASPSAHTAGLTGADSWFWLEPPPSSQSSSISLRGETVTVTASANAVQWNFGDGQPFTGGPGVPYRPGAVPSGAVRHLYGTRCLSGDQGHDPSVSSSCGAGGYPVQASVAWGISYQASGPVPAGGSLPSRSTSTSITYPVSEVRAFLTTSGGGQ
jgi:hypothetical protein